MATTKTILLSKGQKALVDAEDFPFLSTFKWTYFSGAYAVRNVTVEKGRYKIVLMHRVILKAKDGEQVDHINGNGLDNRKKNLRLCTHEENQRNMKKHKDNTSGFKGVSWYKPGHKWRASIGGRGPKHIGYFQSRVAAAKAYNAEAIRRFGEFAKLNNV